LVHGLGSIGEVAPVQVPGIPIEQDPAEVENDGFDGR